MSIENERPSLPRNAPSPAKIIGITAGIWVAILIAVLLLIPVLALSAVLATIIVVSAIALLPVLIGIIMIWFGNKITEIGGNGGIVRNIGWVIIALAISIAVTIILIFAVL